MPKPGKFAEKIEILPVSLLDEQRLLTNEIKGTARALKLEFGWHYLLDLVWILRELGTVKGKRLMDAGAGVGVMQWHLAWLGAEVISVDRDSRVALPLHLRSRVRVEGLRPGDLLPARQVLKTNWRAGNKSLFTRIKGLLRDAFYLLGQPDSSGRVLIYNQDLANLVDLPDHSLDTVVSVSALEHNSQEGLAAVVQEIMRVLKPGGALLATLTAGGGQDTWHAPSSGWCYSEPSLRRLFGISAKVPSNYDQFEELFTALRGCAELRDNLASFYFKSDKNGMPWGVWNPQYQPVGIIKVKR